ncbi:MAG: NAD(P)-binding protein [bacterium]
MKFSRRSFLLGSASAGLLAWAGFSLKKKASPEKISGSLQGANFHLGHRLREGNFPPPSEFLDSEVVIAGGGMAGLSAAWKFKRSAFDRFTLLELEDSVGGNSQSGENAVSPYPWGAHYVPLPSPESHLVRELFEELGVIEGYDEQQRPRYNEYFLCADPEERLYRYGEWQEGLIPFSGNGSEEKRQFEAFLRTVEGFKSAHGNDGKRAFAIPMEYSSRDPRFLELDAKTMAQWMKENGWDTPTLRWYVNYCCRDDYGTSYDQVSAWAGIHYFASRVSPSANAAGATLVTWPEGNGWLVKKLREKVAEKIRPRSLVFRVARKEKGAEVDFFDPHSQKSTRVTCRALVYAAPRFTVPHTFPEFQKEPPSYLNRFTYAPWMVANVTLSEIPGGKGAPLAWDNVIYGSDSLGYVVATHQNLKSHPKETVITYYYPLSESDPVSERKKAYATSVEEWKARVLKELHAVHPELKGKVKNVDAWLWGHGMIRPIPGFVWGPERQAALKPLPPVFFAHSDMSGLSLFEEAQFRGVSAAEDLMRHLKIDFKPSIDPTDFGKEAHG